MLLNERTCAECHLAFLPVGHTDADRRWCPRCRPSADRLDGWTAGHMNLGPATDRTDYYYDGWCDGKAYYDRTYGRGDDAT